MTVILLGTLIPIAYLAVAGYIFSVCFRTFRANNSFDPEGSAGFIAVFWPIGGVFFLAWVHANRVDGRGDLSRRQQRDLEYKRQSAQIAADAAKAQREWQQLLAEEQRP